ncbi:MAG: glycerophosphodiester phosphodiesterase [Phycisphaerae bacterium]
MRTVLHSMAAMGLTMCASCTSRLPLGSPDRILVIAHRGNSAVAPENTLSAFRSAVAAGATYVELDARPSEDGTLYVLHDATLDRTTDAKEMFKREKIKIRETPDSRLDKLDAGRWFDAKFAGERLPKLTEALDVIQAGSLTLLEHKDGSAEDYVRLLRQKRLVGKLVVQSFDWEFLRRLHELEPCQVLGALGDKELTEERLARIAAGGARIVGWKHTDLTAQLVCDLHARGHKVWAWTANEPANWQRLLGFGVDGIITDHPAQLAAWLAEQAVISHR